MLSHARSVLCAAGLILTPSTAFAIDYCFVLNVYQPDKYRPGQSIALRPIDTSDLPQAPGESHDEIRAFMAERLTKELTSTKYFSSVVSLDANQSATTDLVLSSAFVGISEGSRWKRVLAGRAGATLRVKGQLSATRPRESVIADYECYRENVGGVLGVTGGLTGLFSGEGGNRSNIEKFAEALADSFKDVEKDIAKFAKDKKGDPLRGTSEPPEAKSANADPDAVKDELSGYVVSTPREDWVQADVLWMTAAALAANEKVNETKPEAGDLTAKRKSVWSAGVYGRGFLLDLEPLAQFKGKDVYVIAATFESNTQKHGPFIWDLRAVEAQSSLGRVDVPGRSVKPLQVIDGPSPTYLINRKFRLLGEFLWRSHPTLFVFPATLPDGTPLVPALDQKIEFRTSVENHPVVVTFTPSHLGATTIDGLLVGR